jgi:hypothetical protein
VSPASATGRISTLRVALAAFLAAFSYMADLPVGSAEGAHGVSFGLRLGGGALALSASEDTPIMGGTFSDAIDLYNSAADAYNASHGLRSSQAKAAPTMTSADMNLRDQLMLVTPTLEAGGDGYFFKLEAPLGFGDRVRTYGLGVYPLNVGGHLGGDRAQEVAGYLSAGVALSYATFVDADDAAGGLFQGRLAGGLRLRMSGGYAMTFELGYSPWALGGVVDFGKKSAIKSYDPRGAAPPPRPGEIAQGGEQSGMIDVSVGFALP